MPKISLALMLACVLAGCGGDNSSYTGTKDNKLDPILRPELPPQNAPAAPAAAELVR